jgi:SPP1 gp7 family putative phage head morphogenesis protein
MSISDETLRLTDALRLEIEQITNRQTHDLVAAWARAWDEVAGDLERALADLADAAGEDRITRAMVRRSERLTRALHVIADQLGTLAADANVLIVGDLRAVIDAAGTAQHSLISSQLPPDGQGLAVSWSRVDRDAIDAIVRRATEQITALTQPLSSEATAAVKRELVRGLSSGVNPRETARRMLQRTEGEFNGGLTRALTIARTETLDAHRAGAKLAQHANADVLQGWVWTAQLGARTCAACFGMHGSEHDLDEPGPLGHQNCRCARTPLTKTWAELGIDLPEPKSVIPDATSVFADLDPAEQLQVLGRGRFDAWKSGDLPMDQWAVRRSTDGWRDSYVPVPVSSARLAS